MDTFQMFKEVRCSGLPRGITSIFGQWTTTRFNSEQLNLVAFVSTRSHFSDVTVSVCSSEAMPSFPFGRGCQLADETDADNLEVLVIIFFCGLNQGIGVCHIWFLTLAASGSCVDDVAYSISSEEFKYVYRLQLWVNGIGDFEALCGLHDLFACITCISRTPRTKSMTVHDTPRHSFDGSSQSCVHQL